MRERRMAVERIRESQAGVENKHLKPYQIAGAFMDYKLYLFFLPGVVYVRGKPYVALKLTSRQYSQRRDLKLRHHHYPGLWFQHVGYHHIAGWFIAFVARIIH